MGKRCAESGLTEPAKKCLRAASKRRCPPMAPRCKQTGRGRCGGRRARGSPTLFCCCESQQTYALAVLMNETSLPRMQEQKVSCGLRMSGTLEKHPLMSGEVGERVRGS